MFVKYQMNVFFNWINFQNLFFIFHLYVIYFEGFAAQKWHHSVNRNENDNDDDDEHTSFKWINKIFIWFSNLKWFAHSSTWNLFALSHVTVAALWFYFKLDSHWCASRS